MMSGRGSVFTLAAIVALSLNLSAADEKLPRIEKLAERALKAELPIQEAINKVMEEYGGIPIGAGLEKHDRGGSGSVFWVVTVRPAKEGMPATVSVYGIDANTGELLETHNITRRKDGELALKEKARGKRERKIEAHFNKMGITDETVAATRTALRENGLPGKQAEGALWGVLKTAHEMRSEGKDYEMDPRLRGYLKNDVGLTDKQIELVEGHARRIVTAMVPKEKRRD